jgi:hypothetical protein
VVTGRGTHFPSLFISPWRHSSWLTLYSSDIGPPQLYRGAVNAATTSRTSHTRIVIFNLDIFNHRVGISGRAPAPSQPLGAGPPNAPLWSGSPRPLRPAGTSRSALSSPRTVGAESPATPHAGARPIQPSAVAEWGLRIPTDRVTTDLRGTSAALLLSHFANASRVQL